MTGFGSVVGVAGVAAFVRWLATKLTTPMGVSQPAMYDALLEDLDEEGADEEE